MKLYLEKLKWRSPMVNASISLILLSLFFYVEEAISEKPHILRAAVFLAGIVVATLSLPA